MGRTDFRIGRLARDENVNVRATLLGLLRDGNRDPDLLARMASSDPDAYLRATAAAPLPEQASG
jgi:hypothetical protein